jgi:hypothetical protein
MPQQARSPEVPTEGTVPSGGPWTGQFRPGEILDRASLVYGGLRHSPMIRWKVRTR